MSSPVTAPRTEQELMQRATRLAGRTLGHVAMDYGITVPRDLKRAKGWTGKLMELALGATASTLPEPDFEYIGVELKTLPIGVNGRPRESTYICTVPLATAKRPDWHDSTVKKKLSRVLWVPFEADRGLGIALRRISNPFLWSPDHLQERILRGDWEEFMERIALGELDHINARHGRALQIRPKAANAGAVMRTATASGEPGPTLPRGFYLRSGFTWEILKKVQSSTF